MRIFILHYYDDKNSFNHRLFLREKDFLEQKGYTVDVTALSHDNFNPVSDRSNFVRCANEDFFSQKREERVAAKAKTFHPDIEKELVKLENCDFLLWQFPLRNFSMPAVLKGYVDKHFALGRIYGGLQIYENGYFRGKSTLLSIVCDEDEENFGPGRKHGDIYEILYPIHRGIAQYVGFNVLIDKIFYAPDELLFSEQEELIQKFLKRLDEISSESPFNFTKH